MRVAFDSQIFVAQRFGGISRYFSSLALHLAQGANVEVRLDAVLQMNDHACALNGQVRAGWHVDYRRSLRMPLLALNSSIGLWRNLTRPADVVHRTYYYPQPPAPRSAKVVLSVFDLIHEKFGDSFKAVDRDRVIRAKRRAVQAADMVVCISHSTRNDLLAAHPVDPARVFVTHLGYDPLPEPSDRPDEWHGRPYLLFVGTRPRYKNFARLLEAFASSSRLRRDFDLVCFGGGAWTQDESASISRLGVASHVHHRSGNDHQLAEAYRNAVMFVYPSLYEGFGIPPLEAMSAGCPVACSDVSSIPEVVGPAGAYFDPTDVDAITAVLEAVAFSDTQRRVLIGSGYERCTKFSWPRCAAETLALYRGDVPQ
jgi:glycosyltransferase involved in cell wall biosynthesis